LIEYIRKK